MTKRAHRDPRASAAPAFLRRAAFLAFLWWILAEGRVDAPLLAAALVCAAAAVSLALQAPVRARWRPWRLPRLVLYFLEQSLLGGWDVARRALAPSLPVQPALVRFELTLPAGFPTVLFAWIVSLTPGTASVAIEDQSLVVHALDVRMGVEERLRALEAHVALLFI
jgi:multicomponent Na+:H+ antiporter subunit E